MKLLRRAKSGLTQLAEHDNEERRIGNATQRAP